MKTGLIKTVFIAALLLTGNLAAHANPNHRMQKNIKERVRSEIAAGIPCPDFVETNSVINQVKAVVQVDESGNVKVLEINSANTRLQNYVSGRLQNMKIKTPGEGQKFVLLINFDVAE